MKTTKTAIIFFAIAITYSKLLKDISKIENSQFDTFGVDKKALLGFIESQTKNKMFVDFGEITPKQLLKVRRELNKYQKDGDSFGSPSFVRTNLPYICPFQARFYITVPARL